MISPSITRPCKGRKVKNSGRSKRNRGVAAGRGEGQKRVRKDRGSSRKRSRGCDRMISLTMPRKGLVSLPTASFSIPPTTRVFHNGSNLLRRLYITLSGYEVVSGHRSLGTQFGEIKGSTIKVTGQQMMSQ